MLWILITATLIHCVYAQSKDETSFQFKFKRGETLKYVMSVSSQTKTRGANTNNMEQLYNITETVEDVDDKGVATIKIKYSGIKHKLTAPMKNIAFDSASDSDIKKAKENSSISLLAYIAGKEITIKVKDSEIVDMDTKAIKEALQKESAKEGKIAFIENSIRNFTGNFFPPKPIKRGESWGKQVTTFLPTFGALRKEFVKIVADPHYKLEDVSSGIDKRATLGLTAELNVSKADNFESTKDEYHKDEKNGDATGKIIFSLTKGRLLKSSITQTFTTDTDPPIGGAIIGSIKSETTQKIEVELK